VPTGVSAVFVFTGKTVAFMRRRCYETEHERLDPTTDNVYHFDGGGDWIMRQSHDLAIVWQTKGRGDCREE
jgi:hypothetical protein